MVVSEMGAWLKKKETGQEDAAMLHKHTLRDVIAVTFAAGESKQVQNAKIRSDKRSKNNARNV